MVERLTLADGCDVVYAVLVARLEADFHAVQQAALMSAVFGGKPEFPSLDDQIVEFDQQLAQEPERVDRVDLELRDALGLRRPGA